MSQLRLHFYDAGASEMPKTCMPSQQFHRTPSDAQLNPWNVQIFTGDKLHGFGASSA